MNRSRFLAIAALILLAASTAHAQFPQTLTIPATSSAIVLSNGTKAGVRYTVTVTGTYSMWPSYDRYGVDAAYVYDVPQVEVTSFRWPPAMIYPIPHWVGDTITVPPFPVPGFQFRFNSRDNIGFRINGQPLANVGVNATHRYSATVIGDGGPISLQILDSAFNIQRNMIVPRYEDNSGQLTVVIEEQPFIDVCDVATLCRDNRPGSLVVSASLLDYGSGSAKPRNILGDPGQISLMLDGTAIRPDSVVCGRWVKEGTAYSLVFDRSYSMDDDWNGVTKLEALKRAGTNFLRTVGPADSLMLITFNGSWRVEQTWTGDTARMGARIRGINTGPATAYRDAAYEGVGQAARHYLTHKAVILLTDGEDNSSTISAAQVIARARQTRVPIYVVGVSLSGVAENELRRIADSTGGKYFVANDQRTMDSVFANIGREIHADACCSIYFTPPSSFFAHVGPRKFDIEAYNAGGTAFMQTLEVNIPAECGGVSAIEEYEEIMTRAGSVAVTVAPNPLTDRGTVSLALPMRARVEIELVSSDGDVAIGVVDRDFDEGRYDLPIDAGSLPSGIYFVRIGVDGFYRMVGKVVVQR